MPYHWTARLTEAEAAVVKKFSCTPEWMESFAGEEDVIDLEASGAPMLCREDISTKEEHQALSTLEGNAYVWPLEDGKWCLDEYGLPIWLALNGLKSSCTVETIN